VIDTRISLNQYTKKHFQQCITQWSSFHVGALTDAIVMTTTVAGTTDAAAAAAVEKTFLRIAGVIPGFGCHSSEFDPLVPPTEAWAAGTINKHTCAIIGAVLFKRIPNFTT